MFTDLTKTKILNDYHSALYKLTGVATDFVSESGECFSLCPPEHCNPLCLLLRSTLEGEKACALSDRSHMEECKVTRRACIYECHAGLTEIIVPLFVEDNCIGFLSSGQVLLTKPTERGFRKFLGKISGLPLVETELRSTFFRTPVLNLQQANALADLLSLIGNYIVESENRLSFLESIKEKKLVQAARKFIERHYQRELTVAEMAGEVHLSESHFSHLFKRETGLSPVKFLNRVRIGNAIELLRNTAQSITDIAFAAGFQNLTHFNRIFRAHTGLSPSKFRKKQKT